MPLNVNKEDYPAEITIVLKDILRTKKDKYNFECYVAHDYVEFRGQSYLIDKDDKEYCVKNKQQIPIAVMFEFMKLLNKSPNLTEKHLKNKGYYYKKWKSKYADWHCETNKGRTKIITIPLKIKRKK